MDTAAPTGPRRLAFAGFVLDLHARVLRAADGGAVELRPQAYAVLEQLALKAGALVSKDQLMQAVWPGVVVTDDSLVQAVGDLRQALGAGGRDAVRTVPRRGYMLVGTEAVGEATAAAPARGQRARVPGRTWAAGIAIGLLLAATLAWTLRPAAAPHARSVAVLAFRGAPPGEAAAGLARALAAALVGELARSPDLFVISGQSSFQLDPSSLPLPEIGRRLHARYLIDGNVEREGERLQLRVDLIDASDGHLLWTRREQADRTSIDTVQQSLVGRIAGSLQSRVAGAEQRRAVAAPQSLDVVSLTGQGNALMLRYSAPDLARARERFTQALALDPDHAPAWIGLGLASMAATGLRFTDPHGPGGLAEAMAQIQHGLGLQPDLPVGWVALSQAQGLAGDTAAALHAAERCLAVSPNEAGCFYALGAAQLRLGRAEAAVASLTQAMDRNPLPPPHFSAFLATALWSAGRYADALQAADACLALAPDFWRCRQDRVASLVELGRLDDARTEATRLHGMVPAMTARWFGAGFSPEAAPLARRRVAAALAAGMAAP